MQRRKNPKTYFHRALAKYGIDKFDWKIIYKSNDEYDTHFVKEEMFIKKLNTYSPSGYNCTAGGGGSAIIVTPERRRKIRATMKERGINFASLGATEAARKYWTGRHQSEEHRQKRAELQRRKLTVNGVTYASCKEAALRLGVCAATITNLIRKGVARKHE